MGREQAQHHTAEYAGIHGLDTQHHSLPRTVQTGEAVRLGQQAKLRQGNIACREIDKIAHQGNERRLMFFPRCQYRRNANAEQHTEV